MCLIKIAITLTVSIIAGFSSFQPARTVKPEQTDQIRSKIVLIKRDRIEKGKENRKIELERCGQKEGKEKNEQRHIILLMLRVHCSGLYFA